MTHSSPWQRSQKRRRRFPSPNCFKKNRYGLKIFRARHALQLAFDFLAMIVRQTLGFHNRSLLIVYLIILRANWKEGVEISARWQTSGLPTNLPDRLSSHCVAYGGPVFRRFAPPSPSAARCSGAADALWACPRASSRFAAFACALRVLAPPAASRPPTASGRDGNAFLPTVRNRRSTSHAKRACGSCCSLGLLRPVSRTARGLRAPRKKSAEMTHTPSFLMRASFFRDFVNTLRPGGQRPPGLSVCQKSFFDKLVGCERIAKILSQPAVGN